MIDYEPIRYVCYCASCTDQPTKEHIHVSYGMGYPVWIELVPFGK